MLCIVARQYILQQVFEQVNRKCSASSALPMDWQHNIGCMLCGSRGDVVLCCGQQRRLFNITSVRRRQVMSAWRRASCVLTHKSLVVSC